MSTSEELRELAAWYREFAEKTLNPWIWAARVKTAQALEAEALLAERGPAVGERSRGLGKGFGVSVPRIPRTESTHLFFILSPVCGGEGLKGSLQTDPETALIDPRHREREHGAALGIGLDP